MKDEVVFWVKILVIFACLMYALKACIHEEWRECEDNGGTYFKMQCIGGVKHE